MTGQIRHNLERLTVDAILVALALALSIAEHWIPLELVVPLPGIKLGLANIVTLFALLRLKPRDALAILLIRCMVMGSVFGLMYFLFSLAGGLLALLVMWLLRPMEGKVFSVIGISIAGAAAHNAGQIVVASLVLQEPLLIWTYLPALLLTGLAAGMLTGIAAMPVIRLWKIWMPDQKPADKANGIRPQAMTGLIVLLAAGLIAAPLAGCGAKPGTTPTGAGNGLTKYSYEFVGTFDTVIQLIGYAEDEKAFAKYTAAAEKQFRELHQLFDPYHDYPGINNLKTINDKAGTEPVKVAPELFELIKKCIGWNRTLSDKTNIALGRTILLWQSFRDKALENPEESAIPDDMEIKETLAYSHIENIVLDEAEGTVYLKDPEMKLDLGSVGKGYAAELVAQELIGMGAESMIINAGFSNVRLIGEPADERAAWSIGLQNPRSLLPDNPASNDGVGESTAAEPELAAIFHVNGKSVVTSGDYQRYYVFGGKVYHHLIDPADGQPARFYRSVTVVAEDSGLADFLSTALFLLPFEKSRELAESLPGVDVLWIFAGGRIEMTKGLESVTEVNP